jgi:cytochrome c-type biogenesis protein CcmH
MTWLIAVLVALAAFAVAVLAFRLPRVTWTSLATALVFGLAGYTLQASPTVPGAPKDAVAESYTDEWEIIPSRQLLVSGAGKSTDPAMITADAFARQGQFEDASVFYRTIVTRNPRDFEAWVALGNALVEQADGQLTQASMYAFRQANLLQPNSPAPGYFLGLSLVRQGRMMEARGVWREALDGMADAPVAELAPGNAPVDAPTSPRAFMADRVERLDTMLQQMGALPPEQGAEAPVSAAGQDR